MCIKLNFSTALLAISSLTIVQSEFSLGVANSFWVWDRDSSLLQLALRALCSGKLYFLFSECLPRNNCNIFNFNVKQVVWTEGQHQLSAFDLLTSWFTFAEHSPNLTIYPNKWRRIEEERAREEKDRREGGREDLTIKVWLSVDIQRRKKKSTEVTLFICMRTYALKLSQFTIPASPKDTGVSFWWEAV